MKIADGTRVCKRCGCYSKKIISRLFFTLVIILFSIYVKSWFSLFILFISLIERLTNFVDMTDIRTIMQMKFLACYKTRFETPFPSDNACDYDSCFPYFRCVINSQISIMFFIFTTSLYSYKIYLLSSTINVNLSQYGVIQFILVIIMNKVEINGL